MFAIVQTRLNETLNILFIVIHRFIMSLSLMWMSVNNVDNSTLFGKCRRTGNCSVIWLISAPGPIPEMFLASVRSVGRQFRSGLPRRPPQQPWRAVFMTEQWCFVYLARIAGSCLSRNWSQDNSLAYRHLQPQLRKLRSRLIWGNNWLFVEATSCLAS